MKTIFKYPLKVRGEQIVNMPVGAQPLSVQVQHGTPCLWALIDPQADPRDHVVSMYGTGHPILLSPGKFVDTYQLEDGDLVFHVFVS